MYSKVNPFAIPAIIEPSTKVNESVKKLNENGTWRPTGGNTSNLSYEIFYLELRLTANCRRTTSDCSKKPFKKIL